MGKADRGRRLSTPISLLCFILRRAPVSLRPPPAESSFEVIIGLLANAPLQVPLAPLSLSVSQHSHIDEKRWGSFQSLQMRPVFLLSASSSFFRFICQHHLLYPHTIYCFPALSVTFRSFYCPLTHFTHFPLLSFSVFLRDWIAALHWIWEEKILNYLKKTI